MDTIQKPQWIGDVAKKVHNWRNNPAIFERFCKQIRAYFTEVDKAQKKWEANRKKYFSNIPKDSPLRDQSQCPQELDACSKKESCSKDPARCVDNQHFGFDYCGDISLNEKGECLIPSEVWIPLELCPDSEPRKNMASLPLRDRPHSLGEEYFILFLLHDTVYPQGEKSNPYNQARFTDPYKLVESCATYTYAVEVENIKSYPPNDKTRIESFLEDVEQDLQDIIGQESGDMDNATATESMTRPSEDDEALFRDIAAVIWANPDDYTEAGKWFDDNFGIKTLPEWQPKDGMNPLLHVFQNIFENTVEKLKPDVGDFRPPRISHRAAHRILLLTWLLTDTTDLTGLTGQKEMPHLTELQAFPYDPDDKMLLCRENCPDDKTYILAIREKMWETASQRRWFLYFHLERQDSKYKRWLDAANKAWGVLFGQRQVTAQQGVQQPTTPTAEQTQQPGRPTGSGDTNVTKDRVIASKWNQWLDKNRKNGNHTASYEQYAETIGMKAQDIKRAVDRERKRKPAQKVSQG